MKKWLTVILIIITVTGTFIPCCLTDNCSAEQTSSKSTHQGEGACSPFFSCSTCPGFVKLTRLIEVSEPTEVVLVHHERIIKYSPASYSASLWQPPRFS